MVATPFFYRNTWRVADLRIRRGWFGRTILEASYYQERYSYAWEKPTPAGATDWHRVDMNNPDEVVAVTKYLQKLNKHI